MSNQSNNLKEPSKVIGGPVKNKSRFSRHKKRILVGLGIVLLLTAVTALYLNYSAKSQNQSFVDCVQAGGKTSANSKTITCTDKNGKQSSAANNTVKGTENRTFISGPVTLYYPTDWKAAKASTPPSYKGSTFIALTSPSDSTLQTEPAGPGDNQLESILVVSPTKKSAKKIPAKVLAAKEFVFMPGAKVANLLAVDTNGNGKADLVLLGGPEVKVGDKAVKGYFVYNDKYQIALQGTIANSSSKASTNAAVPEAKDAKALLDSKSASSLVLIVSGIKLN